LLDSAHQWQESVFAELTADWPPEDVQRFHSYLQRFLDAQRERR
jgi:hypothetical protein